VDFIKIESFGYSEYEMLKKYRDLVVSIGGEYVTTLFAQNVVSFS